MLLKREIHWIFVVFDRSRDKALSTRLEEQDKAGAAALRRPTGFGAEPQQSPSPGGFGRRQVPLPETTDGTAPRSVANDRGGKDPTGTAIGLQPAHDDLSQEHAVPLAADDLSSTLLTWLTGELREGKHVQHEAVLCALGALSGYAAQQAIREAVVKPGKLSLDQAFVVIETRSGEVFFFGDLLNAVIVSKDAAQGGARESGHASIWKIVSAAGYEAGAINLYGPAYGLPRAISGVNSYWARGYGNPPPETLIVLGLSQRSGERFFTWCSVAGRTPNPYGIRNEETERHPDIYLCGPPRQPWPEFWNQFRYYG